MLRLALVACLAACSRAPDRAIVIVTQERGTIDSFAGDAKGIAWSDGWHGDNRVHYRATGGEPIEIAKVTYAMAPIAVDDQYVYWGDDDALWRWSRADHRAERRAGIGEGIRSLLVFGDALWIGTPRGGAYRLPRTGDAAPIGGAITDEPYVRDLVVLDGRVAAVAVRYRNGNDRGRTVIAWADQRAAPIADLPWIATTAVSDGHTLYLCDWGSGEYDAPINVWSMTVGHAPALVPGLAETRDVAVNLHGADTRGLYLSDGRSVFQRDPDGTMRPLGRRLMHAILVGNTLVGTRHDADRHQQLVRIDLAGAQ